MSSMTMLIGLMAIHSVGLLMINIRLTLLRERMLEEFANQVGWHRFRSGIRP